MPKFTFTSPDGKNYDVEGPEGATKEEAFGILQQKIGKPAAAPKSTPDAPARPSLFREAYAGVPEAVGATVSGMVAKPVSELAGLGAIPLHAMGAIDTAPDDIKEKVRSAIQIEPRTATGKALTEYNPMALAGKGISWGADKLSQIGAPPPGQGSIGGDAARSGVREAIEQVPGILGAKAGARVAEKIPAKQAGLDVAKGESSLADATRKAAQDAGYVVPAERGIKAVIQGVGGKARSERGLSAINTENATKRLGAEVGAPEGAPLSGAQFENLKDQAGVPYNEMVKAAGPKLEVTDQFREAVRTALNKASESSDVNPSLSTPKRILRGFWKRVSGEAGEEPLPGAGKPGILGTIEKAAQEQPGAPIMRTIEQAASETPGAKAYGSQQMAPPPSSPVPTTKAPTLSTEWAKDQISSLRREAKADYKGDKVASGDTRMALAHSLETLIENNLARTGQQGLVEAFRASRERFAKIYLLERVTNDATGKVDLSKLAALSESKAYKGVLTGEFKTAADFAKAYRKGAQKPTGEAMPHISVVDGLFALGTLAAGHPGIAAAEIGGRIGIPAASRAGMLQNAAPSYQAGPGTANLLRALGIGTQGQLDRPPL